MNCPLFLLGAGSGGGRSPKPITAAQRIDAGWIFGLTAFWESADKRWVAQAMLDNLRHQRSSSDDRASKLILRASYLF